ncbi:MAG: glycoside hydrolase family 5 protein [Polyangia bacterium]
MIGRPSLAALLVIATTAMGGCGSGGSPAPSHDSGRTGCAAAPTVPIAPGGYYVNGNTVCTAGGRPHLFHGVDRPSLEWSSGGQGLRAADFQRMAAWKANVVRIALNQDFWLAASPLYDPGYAPLVDQAVRWAEAAGMDVILDLHWSDAGTLGKCAAKSGCQQKMADRNSVTFWADVASRYAGDGRVLFELYNEPHDITWDVWLAGGNTGDGYQAAGMQQLYDTVRAAGADNLVNVGGLDRAYDLSGVPDHRVAGYNIAYATHPYGGSGAERRSRFWDLYWGALTATDPVIVTEFGDTTTCSDDYAREVLDYADAHGAGWTAWAWFPGGCAFPSLLTDWNARPSVVGDTVKAALSHYDDAAAAAPPGWPIAVEGGSDLRFSFDASDEGWHLAMPGAATLTCVATDGDPSAGALRLTATFTGYGQYADALYVFGAPGIDLTAKTLRARVRLLAGSLFDRGVQLVAFSGPTSVEGDGPSLDAGGLSDGQWASLDFPLEQARSATFDPSHVVGFAVRLRTGSASAESTFPSDGGATIIEIDDVAD